MQLIELSFQGVRGFGPQVKVQLQPGYWVLQPTPAGMPPLGSLLSALLFADGRGGDAVFCAPGATESTAGIMLQGQDDQTYYLVRTLGRAGALHRYAPATQQFEQLSTEASEIGQVVRNQVGSPSKLALEGLFHFTLSQLPTHRPRTAVPTSRAMTPSRPMLATAMPVEAATDLAGAQHKLAALAQELALAEEVEKLQYQSDGLASRVFALETQLKSTEALKARVEEARVSYEAAPTPQSLQLPPDILERVEQFPRLMARRDELLAKLEADREVDDAPSFVGPALRSDPRFIAAVGVGLVTLTVGWAFHNAVRYVALFDIPAFAAAGLLALRHLDLREESERGQRRGNRRADREQKIHDQYQADSAPVRNAVQQLNLDAPAAIADLLSQRPLLEGQYLTLREQLQAAEDSPEQRQARGELGTLRAQQRTLEDALGVKGAYVRDGREIEREMARLSESITLAQKGPNAAPPPPVAAVAPASNALPDPTPALLALAADLFTTDVTGAIGILKDRAMVYLNAFTDRRLSGVEIDSHGHASVLSAQGQGTPGKTPAEDLAGSDLDLLYLALRFAVVEKFCARLKVPVIVEDVMAGVDLPRLPMMGKALKNLSRLTQVLHVTERPEFVGLADARAVL